MQILARIKVLATTLVTWLTIAAVVVQQIIAETTADWPWLAEYASRALAVLLAVIAIVRRVTTVEPAIRGLLEK